MSFHAHSHIHRSIHFSIIAKKNVYFCTIQITRCSYMINEHRINIYIYIYVHIYIYKSFILLSTIFECEWIRFADYSRDTTSTKYGKYISSFNIYVCKDSYKTRTKNFYQKEKKETSGGYESFSENDAYACTHI